ncbi:hypothetical protein FRB90_009896 [Tulasnella sp. 427]|nr:hypothetical protein FRB90_009896 [Tulasnella sp. 427]
MSRLFCITAVHTLLSVKVLNDNFDPTRLLSPIRYSGNDFGTFEELPPEAHLSLLKAHLLQDVLAGWPRFNFVTQIRQPARLSKSELRLGQDGDRILTFLLHGIARKEWESVGGTETGLTRLTAMHAGMLLKGSEKELMSGILEAMRRLLPQRMRSGLDEQDLNLVKHFLEALRGTPKTRFSWIADGALARNPQDWRRCVDPGSSWWRSVPLSQAQNATMESLNAFLSDTENLIQAHESQTTLAQVRDPEIRWCYSRQEPWAMPKFRAWLSDDTESFETSDSDW